MSIVSPCLVQFIPTGGDALTLVAVGGKIVSMPRWEVSQDLFESDGIDAANSFFKPLGNALVTFTLGVRENRPDDSQDAFIEAERIDDVHLLQIDGALVITSPDRIWTYSNAVIANIAPGRPSNEGDPILTRIYTITSSLPDVPLRGPEPVELLTIAVSAAEVGGIATITPGTWTGDDLVFTYQWYRSGIAIPGETSLIYSLTADDNHSHLYASETATNIVNSITTYSPVAVIDFPTEGDTFRRPGGTSQFDRPGGTDHFLRP